MTYDTQDLILDLRKLGNEPDSELAHIAADNALLRFIDDDRVIDAFKAITKRYS